MAERSFKLKGKNVLFAGVSLLGIALGNAGPVYAATNHLSNSFDYSHNRIVRQINTPQQSLLVDLRDVQNIKPPADIKQEAKSVVLDTISIKQGDCLSVAIQDNLQEKLGVDLSAKQYMDLSNAVGQDNDIANINLVYPGQTLAWGEQSKLYIDQLGVVGKDTVVDVAAPVDAQKTQEQVAAQQKPVDANKDTIAPAALVNIAPKQPDVKPSVAQAPAVVDQKAQKPAPDAVQPTKQQDVQLAVQAAPQVVQKAPDTAPIVITPTDVKVFPDAKAQTAVVAQVQQPGEIKSPNGFYKSQMTQPYPKDVVVGWLRAGGWPENLIPQALSV